MVEITKSAAFILMKVLDNLQHEGMSIGQMRMCIKISSAINSNPDVSQFASHIASLSDNFQREEYAEKNGSANVSIADIGDQEIKFMRENWEIVRQAFVKNLDKRIIVNIADAFGVTEE